MGLIGSLVGLVVATIFVVYIVVQVLHDANTTGWSSTETSVFNNIPLLTIVGLLVLSVGAFGMSRM